MAPQPKGKSSKHPIQHPDRASWRETEVNGSTLILIVVKEAETHAPFVELQRAASVALITLQTIQGIKVNKEAYERLGDDAGGLIVAIWRSYKKAEVPDEWLSAGMREILEDLTHTLENIRSFVQEQLSKSKVRILFSRADAGKINEYREHLNYAMQKFELQSHMNINEVLIQLMRKNDQLSEQILHLNEEEDVKRLLEITAREARDREEAERIQEEELKAVQEITMLERMKQVEIDNRASEERWHSDKLKKIEKETKDRQSELERLRAAASAVETANRLRKEQEEEIAELRRKIAAHEESLRVTAIQAQSSNQKSRMRRNGVKEEEDEKWGGNAMIEEVTSDSEDQEIPQPFEESDEESTTSEEEKHSPPSSRQSSKANGKPQSSSGNPLPDVDNLMVQLRRLTPMGGSLHGSEYNSRSSSPMYFPMYGSPPGPPPMGPYGFGYGPGTVVNSGVGNVTNTSISNVGNDNSVKKVYHTGRQRRAPAQLCN